MSKALNIRIEDDLSDELESVAKELYLDKTTLAKEAIRAIVRYVREHGSITFPIVVTEARLLSSGPR